MCMYELPARHFGLKPVPPSMSDEFQGGRRVSPLKRLLLEVQAEEAERLKKKQRLELEKLRAEEANFVSRPEFTRSQGSSSSNQAIGKDRANRGPYPSPQPGDNSAGVHPRGSVGLQIRSPGWKVPPHKVAAFQAARKRTQIELQSAVWERAIETSEHRLRLTPNPAWSLESRSDDKHRQYRH